MLQILPVLATAATLPTPLPYVLFLVTRLARKTDNKLMCTVVCGLSHGCRTHVYYVLLLDFFRRRLQEDGHLSGMHRSVSILPSLTVNLMCGAMVSQCGRPSLLEPSPTRSVSVGVLHSCIYTSMHSKGLFYSSGLLITVVFYTRSNYSIYHTLISISNFEWLHRQERACITSFATKQLYWFKAVIGSN